MKKLSVLVLSVLLALVCAAGVMAEALDMDYFRGNESYVISENEEAGVAYVSTGDFFTPEQKSFAHSYEHPELYSYITTDIVVQDYFEEEPWPVMRTWINFRTNEAISVDSVTFAFNGKEYTFSELANAGEIEENDGGYAEDMVIVFGEDNVDFLLDLTDYLDQFDFDHIPSIPFVLHGDTDVEGEWSADSVTEFYLLAIDFINVDGFDYTERVGNATPLEITEVK